jgi:elongation factor Ts
MSISASEVNKLRQMTGAGMMDCKKALTETGGDFDAAVDFLRKKGQKISANRADRKASEGAVIAKTNADNTIGVIVELNCETDFVAKNDEFVKFANDIADVALANEPADLEALKSLQVEGITIEKKLLDEMGKIGEKIDVSNYVLAKGAGLVNYIHAGNKIGVLVELNKSTNDSIVGAGKDVAMQIAAMNPIAVDEKSVSEETKEREMAIGREQALAEGKPENIIDRIAEGKLKKFYKDNTLLHQDFVKDGSKSVAKMLDEVENGLTVVSFKRVNLGA